MQKILFFFLVLLSFSNTLKAQSDSTEINQSGYFLTFVKKVYLNPTVKIRTKAFKTKTNLEFVALPDLASEKTNASTGFEKGLQKVLRFLMQSDGGVRFYFNPDSTTHPFRFWSSENLWCKFKQADLDSIDYYLNHNFADGNISMTNALRFETTIDKALDYIEKCLTANPQACGEEPQNETTEINTKPLSVSLHNRANSKYDIDVKQYEKLESNYAKAFDIHTQQDWYAPAKLLVANETAEPVALAIHSNEGDFLKQNIKIEVLKTHALLPIDQASTEDSLFFSLPSSMPAGDPVEVIVKYKSPKDSLTYTVGFFMVNVMERETKNLVLIPANGFVISSTFKDSVETELEKIYGQASVDFNVTIETGLAFPNDYPTTIEIESSGLFSNYTPDLRDYVGEVQDLPNYDEDNFYLVIGLESFELQGYMPRARNIGFIFKGASNKPKVIAHEIGHGAFHFRHIFAEEELGEEEQGQTNNIMDYVVNPKDLYLHQWNFIKDPAFVSWFGGDDEEGELTITQIIPDDFRNPGSRTITCFAKSGALITLPSNTIELEFATIDPLFYVSNGEYTNNDAPVGTLVGFTIETADGKTTYRYRGSGGNVYYIIGSDETKKYTDSLTKIHFNNLNPITSFPFYENRKFGFTIYKVSIPIGIFPYLNNLESYKQVRDNFIQNNSFLNLFSQFSIIDYVTGITPNSGDEIRSTNYIEFFKNRPNVKVDGKLGVTLSGVGRTYLENYKLSCNSSNPFAPVIISNAIWISRFESIESISKCKFDQFVNSEAGDLFRAFLPQPQCTTCNVQPTYTLNDAIFDKFLKFRRFISEIKESSDENDELIDQIKVLFNSNESLYDIYINNSLLLDKLKTIDDCALENLDIDIRIFLINLLEPQNEEELILKVIRTTEFNSQVSALINRIFEGDGNTKPLFERLWDRFHGEEFHKLINKLSEYTLIAKYGEEVTAEITMGNLDRIYIGGLPRNGSFDIKEINYDWIDGHKFSFFRRYYETTVIVNNGSYYDRNHSIYDDFDYSDVINITFSSSSQDILKYDDNYSNKTIALPAFHLAYLIYERNKSDNIRVARVIGNLIAIAAAIPTGGASLTLVGGISIAVASGDIIVALNEEQLSEGFLEVWSLVQWFDVGLGAMNVGKATYKYTVNTAKRFKFVYSELSTKIGSNADYGDKLIGTLKKVITEMEVLGLSCWSSVLNTRLIARLEEAIVKAKFGMISDNAELIVKGEIEGFIKINGVEKKVFNIKPSSNGAYLESTNGLMTTKLAPGDKVVGKFNKARYKKGNDIVVEDLYIVKTSTGVKLATEGILDVQKIKASIVARIANKQGWVLKYTDDEIKQILKNGKELNLPESEIEDIILNGCRPDKTFSKADLISQTNFWNVVKQRGYPNLFQSLNEYDQFSTVIKNLATEWNLPSNSIYTQGSSLRMSNIADIGDLDIAIKVDAATFDDLVERFKDLANNESVKARIGNNGKIGGVDMKKGANEQGSFLGDFYPKFEESFGQSFQTKLGVSNIQISIVKDGSSIDVSPFLKLK